MKVLRLVIAATLATAAANSALAQQAPAPGANAVIDEVVVTGTRRTDRTVTDSASPVDVISSVELRAQPAGNMLDQIKNVVPSFFVG